METRINISNFWTRGVALLIDSIVLGVIGYLLALAIEDFLVRIGELGLLFGLAITLAYQTICNSKIGNGQTIGKRVMGIQVVDINGNYLDVGKSFLRALILSFAYFTVNLSIPGVSDFGVIGILKTTLLASIVIGVVVIYIFNKQTRQSLHDLIVGSYVATIHRNEYSTTLPPVSKTPFYIWGSVVIVLIGATVFAITRQFPVLNNVFDIHARVTDMNGVLRASVVESTKYAQGSKSRSYESKLWVRSLPKGNIENNQLVREVARIIIDNTTAIDSFDVISISLIREFDIGIASQKSSKKITKSPTKWKELLQ